MIDKNKTKIYHKYKLKTTTKVVDEECLDMGGKTNEFRSFTSNYRC